ncbi:MAG: hypothetical protein ACYC35_06180 [Pirellulales bacterium]
MDFQTRLEKAIERGQRIGQARAQDAARRAMTEEEYRRLYAQCRLELSEHIETCLKELPQHFPGFQFETVVDERGWGGTVRRDDLGPSPDGRWTTHFSRLEIVVRPHAANHVLEVAGKGTVRNREIFNRSHYQVLDEADITSFTAQIDLWVLEYAERYAAGKG